MIEGLFVDYAIEPCQSCGEKKAPGFWFRLDGSWTIRCVNDICFKNRWRNAFVKPKKQAQEEWNKEQLQMQTEEHQ